MIPLPDGPLRGLRVLDFSTLLPGPLATAVLAEAGAFVIKVERPGGDELRQVSPVDFAMLNAGKVGVVADLKRPEEVDLVRGLADRADVLVEQFRPGVMARLGLGYDDLARRNPGLVYCSVTGYGSSGARASIAGHDLNYVAATGLLCLVADPAGGPVLPPTLIADIAGGSYPAVINILLALAGRTVSGRGARLDVAMTDNVWPLQYWMLAGALRGESPRPGKERLTGGSPRYQIYPTADGRLVAAAPLEQRFWEVFCDLVGLVGVDRDDRVDPIATIGLVRALVAARDSGYWAGRFAGVDCCCSVVATVAEAVADPAFAERGVLGVVDDGSGPRPVMPLPVDQGLRTGRTAGTAPTLGGTALAEARWPATREGTATAE